jgi:hypothetical protein
MKVTKVGKPLSARVWVGTCSNCGSEAEAVESELTHITESQREGRFSWEKCPVCGAGDDERYGGMLFYPSNTKIALDSFINSIYNTYD